MQIIMNQDEIEEAIIALVHRQLALKEGQNISIDLKAGRGADGFTATLDIRSMLGSIAKPTTAFRGGNSQANETETPEPAETVTKPATARRSFTPAKAVPAQETPAEPEPEPEAEAENTDQPEAETESTPDSEPENVATTTENEDGPAEDPLAVPDTAPPTPKPTSIFNFKNAVAAAKQ